MNARGMSTVPAVILAALAGLATAVFLADWMVVEVRAPEPDNVSFTVPFPLVVADMAIWFIPDDAFAELEVPEELREQRELVLNAVQELVNTPDATLLKVQDGATMVEIAKQGDELYLTVDDIDATVRCTIAVDGVYEALERWDWQHFDPDVLLDMLHASPSGNMLTVEADGARVAINMW